MKIGVGNQVVGEVEEVKKGMIMGLVKVKIPAESKLSSVTTLESIDDLASKKETR